MKIVSQAIVPDASGTVFATIGGEVRWRPAAGRVGEDNSQELGQLPEPLLPLLPGGEIDPLESGVAGLPDQGGYDARVVPVLALRSEALEWRRTRAAALLASCEE